MTTNYDMFESGTEIEKTGDIQINSRININVPMLGFLSFYSSLKIL